MSKGTITGRLKILAFLVFIVSFLPRTWAQEAPSSPQALFPEKTFQFKEVEEGNPVQHSFTVQNKGSEPLKIVKVKPG